MSRCTRYLEEMCASSETVRNCYSVFLIEFFLKKNNTKKKYSKPAWKLLQSDSSDSDDNG